MHVPDPVLANTHLATPDGARGALPRPHRPRGGRRRRPPLARRAPGGGRVRRRRRAAASTSAACSRAGRGRRSSSRRTDRRHPVHRAPPRPAGVPAHARWRGPPSRRMVRRQRLGRQALRDGRARPRASSPTPDVVALPAVRVPCAVHRDEPRRRPSTRCSPRATAPAAPTSSRRAASAGSAGAWAAAPHHPTSNQQRTCVSCPVYFPVVDAGSLWGGVSGRRWRPGRC